jgi:membrane protein
LERRLRTQHGGGTFLLIVIAVAGLVFGAEAARGEIFGQLAGLIGAEGAKAVEGLLAAADRPAQGTMATIVGVLTLLLGATGFWRAAERARSHLARASA